MTFFTPPSDPFGLAPGNAGVPPLVPNLPQTRAALARKLARDLPVIRQQFPDLADSYVRFELDRANKGQYPLSTQQTADVLRTASTGQARTTPPERETFDVLGNIAKDAGDIVRGIPKMFDPRTWIHEAQGLHKTGEALAEGNIPKLLRSPGVRLIPGAYTARNAIKGDWREALSHPLMTGLDVLPVVQKTGVIGRLAETAPGTRVTEALGNVRDTIGRTTIGQLGQEAFAPRTRAMMTGEMGQVARVNLRSNPALANLPEYSDELSRLAQESVRTQVKLDRAIPDPVRQRAIFDVLESDIRRLPDMNLTDAERVAVEQALDVISGYRNYAIEAGELHPRSIAGQTEDLTAVQAKRYDTLSANRDTWRTLTSMRAALTDPSTASLGDIHQLASTALSNPSLTTSMRRQVATGLVHAMDAAGLDTADLYMRARSLSKPRTAPFLSDIQATLDANPQALREGALRSSRLKAAETWLTDTRRFTDAGLAKREQMVQRLEARIVPARWSPTVEHAFNAAVEARLRTSGIEAGSTQAAEALQAVQERNYGLLIDRGIIDGAELARWRNDAVEAWTRARAEGAEPVYLKHAGRPPRPGPQRITTIAPKPSMFRERTWDFTPYEHSITASIDAQRLELLRYEGAQAFTEWMASDEGMRGKGGVETRAEVEQRLSPTARRIAQHRNIPFAKALEDLVRKEVLPWDQVKNRFLGQEPRAYQYSNYAKRDALFVGKPLASALDRMTNPGRLASAMNPVLSVFRTAVLPFSLRWQANNIFGGVVMTTLEDPRAFAKTGAAIKVANEMRQMNAALAKGADFAFSPDVGEIIAAMPERMRASLGTLDYAHAPEQLAKYNAGRTLGRIANQFTKAKYGLEWAAQKSFAVNQLGDDMYRVMAYLSGAEKGGAEAGIALMNKIQPRWIEMTPFERSIIRPLVPFYPFLSHVFRFAYRYPVDHPWRTAVASSFARAEIDDLGTGLPQIMASLIPIGGEDKDGNQTFLDFGAANPFRGLGDDLTLTGFLSETNPLFRSALEQAGFDPASKGPDLYPEVEYDPRTGQLVAKPRSTPGLLTSLGTSIIPQLGLLQSLTGTNAEFRDMLRTNPEAAQRMMLSQVGLPLYWRTYNPNEIAFKGELRRQEQQKAVLSNAIKSGNYSATSRYPDLQPMVQQLQKLQSANKTDQFNPAKNPVQAPQSQPAGSSVVRFP